MKLLPLLLCLFLSIAASGQRITVAGKLLDSLSGEPVRNATLYIDQTQVITQSDGDGRFTISIPQSPSTLLITHVGYHKRAVSIYNTKDDFLIKLLPRKEVMEEVTVNAKVNWEKDWKKWGRIFIEYFIGKDMDRKCVLLNPEVVKFRFDKSQMLLKAWAKRPLLVENKMLGYTIHIDLDSFYYSFRTALFTYRQSKYFEPFKDQTPEQQKAFAANRLRAYAGSEMHFMRTVYKNSLAQEGFRLYKYVGTENAEKKRIRQKVLQMEFEQAKIGTIDISSRGKDTLLYYKTIMSEPGFFFEDSVRVNVDALRKNDASGMVHLHLNTDTFLLEYDPAANREISNRQLKRWATLKDPDQYHDEVYNFLQRAKYESRYSLLAMTEGGALDIHDNGKVENNSSLVTQGFLAVRRMAYDLPWDYDPAKDYAQISDGSPAAGMLTAKKIEFTLESIAKQHSASEMYLHLDKTVYDHDENIWFAAYLLRSNANIDDHQTLYVFLKDKFNKQKIAAQQFVMKEGHSAGYLFIADSIPGGNYKLVAYTNVYLKDQNPILFEQDITIRPYAANFAVNYFERRNKITNDSVYINLEIKNEKGLYAAGATVSYQLRSEEKKLASGKGRVTDYGELIVGLPLREVLGKKLLLESEVKLKNLNASLTTPVLVQGNYANLKYYPEGGDLVDGLPARLSIVIKNLNHKPLEITGRLLQNGQPAGNFKTDVTGVALLEFTPRADVRYSVELPDSIKLLQEIFPPVLREGYALRIDDAVIKDSLKIQVASTAPRSMGYVLVHNYKENYFLEELHFSNQQETISFPAGKIAPGFATVTIFNEKGLPVAERCIYKAPAQQPALKITLDSTTYGNRSKLVAHITATDANGQPTAALVSLSCVPARRIDAAKFRDIVSFNYLNAYSGAGLLSGNVNYIPNTSKHLEQFLLVQGWTRYAWQAMAAENKNNTRFTLVQQGKVLYDGRRIKKPVDVILFRPHGFSVIKTDDKGNFEVPPDMMTAEADWKINFAVNVPNKQGYSIVFENDNDELQKLLATAVDQEIISLPAPDEKPEPGVMAPVIVKARISSEGLMSAMEKQQETCNDWVCMYNVLNCRNHAHGNKPQIGQMYAWQDPNTQSYVKVLYDGCTTRSFLGEPKQENVVFQLNGRYYNKQFYLADYEKLNPAFPEKFTTIYWNPFVATNDQGEAMVSFFTNDLNGLMTLMAQGITGSGPVSARKDFIVK